MKLHLILVTLSLFIFGGGVAAGILWNLDQNPNAFDAFEEAPGERVSLPVPEETATAFAREFSALHSAGNAVSVPLDLSFNAKGGDTVRLADFYDAPGQGYLLVNLWATWCAPCVLELPSLDKLRQMYAGKGLNVLAVSIDHARDLEQIETFLETRGIGDFALYLDSSRAVRRAMPARGIPTSFLLDAQGRIFYIFEGDAKWTGQAGQDFFNALLAQNQ